MSIRCTTTIRTNFLDLSAVWSCGAALSPNLVQTPVQYDNFRATCFECQMEFNNQNIFMDLSAVMRGRAAHEQLALDGFMNVERMT